MTSHSVLSNYDLLVHIFSNFSIVHPFTIASRRQYRYWGPQPLDAWREELKREYEKLEENRSTLFNSALSCRAMSEVALDELWSAPRGGIYAVLRLLSNLTTEKHHYTTFKFGIKKHEISRYVCIWVHLFMSHSHREL